ncbi:MAG: DUF885 domain-containing protein, partial [Flavobacteriaceae bacterium]|nr:DUF885 domain-containing protein [Flavobacteriaceae bacterium]
MKKNIIVLGLILLFSSCKKEDNGSANDNFEKYKETFIDTLWKLNPGWASSQGFHKYDSVLVVPDAAYTKRVADFVTATLDSLKGYTITDLSDNNKTDFYMIKNYSESSLFSINELKSDTWNPSEYNVCGSFAEILNGSYDTLETRLKNFGAKMDNISAYYEAAKKNIKNPTVEHTQLAIDQNLGGISVFESDLKTSIEKSKLSETDKTTILNKAQKSVEAIKSYVVWLQKLDNKTPRSFRLGKELYAKKFDFDIQPSYTADEIYQKALAHKKELHEKMFVLADKLWSKYLGTVPKPSDKLQVIRQVIDKISLQHTTPEKFQSEIEKQIPELTAYVKAKNLLYIDPSKPLVVRKEPDYMAGVAGASISSPGPYDKNANTYYNVGSLSGWDAERSESY